MILKKPLAKLLNTVTDKPINDKTLTLIDITITVVGILVGTIPQPQRAWMLRATGELRATNEHRTTETTRILAIRLAIFNAADHVKPPVNRLRHRPTWRAPLQTLVRQRRNAPD